MNRTATPGALDPTAFRALTFDVVGTLIDFETGIPRDRVLHVAQSQYHDIVPARALGLATIWVERRHDREGWGATPAPQEAAEPDLRITSLAELVTLHRRFG